MSHEQAQAHHPAHETAPMHDAIDAWHDHSHDEKPQNAHSEVGNAAMITGVGVALFLVIVAAVVAVYAYYTWYITERLDRAEIATGQDSPAVEARKYKADSLIQLNKGGEVSAAGGGGGAAAYTLLPINEKIDQIAREYASGKHEEPKPAK